MAAPGPLARIATEPRPHGVEHHIARELHEVGVGFDQDRLVAPLEDVPDTSVASIRGLGVHPVQLSHAPGEVRLGGLHDQVVVVAHLAPRVTTPVEPIADLAEEFQPQQAIDVVGIDRLATVTTRSQVVHPSGKLDPQWPRHDPLPGQEQP
jgi:hypothetical protein